MAAICDYTNSLSNNLYKKDTTKYIIIRRYVHQGALWITSVSVYLVCLLYILLSPSLPFFLCLTVSLYVS